MAVRIDDGRVDLRRDVVGDPRRLVVAGVGDAEAAAEVVDTEVAERRDRLDRAAEGSELEARGLRSRGTRRNPPSPLTKASVHEMLGNDYYVRIVTYRGKKYPGRHEPLVSREVFDQCQAVLQSHRLSGDATASTITTSRDRFTAATAVDD